MVRFEEWDWGPAYVNSVSLQVGINMIISKCACVLFVFDSPGYASLRIVGHRCQGLAWCPPIQHYHCCAWCQAKPYDRYVQFTVYIQTLKIHFIIWSLTCTTIMSIFMSNLSDVKQESVCTKCLRPRHAILYTMCFISMEGHFQL